MAALCHTCPQPTEGPAKWQAPFTSANNAMFKNKLKCFSPMFKCFPFLSTVQPDLAKPSIYTVSNN